MNYDITDINLAPQGALKSEWGRTANDGPARHS